MQIDRFVRGRGQGGFALMELMFVATIISTLTTVAIPTYLDATDRSDDAVAMSTLHNAMTEASLAAIGGDAGDSTVTGRDLSVYSDDDGWSAAAMSDSATCFLVHLTTDGDVSYGTTGAENCTGMYASTHAALAAW